MKERRYFKQRVHRLVHQHDLLAKIHNHRAIVLIEADPL